MNETRESLLERLDKVYEKLYFFPGLSGTKPHLLLSLMSFKYNDRFRAGETYSTTRRLSSGRVINVYYADDSLTCLLDTIENLIK